MIGEGMEEGFEEGVKTLTNFLNVLLGVLFGGGKGLGRGDGSLGEVPDGFLDIGKFLQTRRMRLHLPKKPKKCRLTLDVCILPTRFQIRFQKESN